MSRETINDPGINKKGKHVIFFKGRGGRGGGGRKSEGMKEDVCICNNSVEAQLSYVLLLTTPGSGLHHTGRNQCGKPPSFTGGWGFKKGQTIIIN